MSTNVKKTLVAVLLAAGLVSQVKIVKAESNGHVIHGGNFGLGLEVGGPGDWGATAKLWTSHRTAFQFAMKFSAGDSATAQVDYLWHTFGIIHMEDTKGQLPLYIGLGGNVQLSDPTAFAGRIPLGISYIFDRSTAPIDLYLQAVPTLWFLTNSVTDFKIYGELGAHYYF